MIKSDGFRTGLNALWIATGLTWLITIGFAFAVESWSAIVMLPVAVVYSVLVRFRFRHSSVRVILAVLLVVAVLCCAMLAYDVVVAITVASAHASP